MPDATPSPWEYDAGEPENSVPAEVCYRPDGGFPVTICHVVEPYREPENPDGYEVERFGDRDANGPMLAAAREMFAALESVGRGFQHIYPSRVQIEISREDWEAIKAALRKARGRAVAGA